VPVEAGHVVAGKEGAEVGEDLGEQASPAKKKLCQLARLEQLISPRTFDPVFFRSVSPLTP